MDQNNHSLKSQKRILIVRMGGIGDVICTLPAIEALRAGLPDAFIGFAVEEPAYDMVHGHPALDRVHLFMRRRLVREAKRLSNWLKVFREIRNYRQALHDERYDLVLDFQRNFKGAMHAIASGAPERIGFSRPTAIELNFLFNRIHVNPSPAEHWVDKFIAMAKFLGGKPEAASYRLPDAPGSRERVARFLSNSDFKNGFIAMHPGTSGFDLARRWEPERFGEIARKFGIQHGIKTIVTWGPGERELAEKIVGMAGGEATSFIETGSILDLAELYRHARLFIGCDTGPMHLATAVGLPSVVLFGSGNPAAYGPRSAGSRIVAKYQDDRLLPMTSISAEEVFEAGEHMLADMPSTK